jgi:tRNA dimethylallyltransferase
LTKGAASVAILSSRIPIIVAGPSGVGKTVFAVELANRFDGEVISADAFQVYRGMEILTAQPEERILRKVPHHLVGFLSPAQSFDAAQFAALARERIREIVARGKLPIITGGSGLYIKALTHGLAELPSGDVRLRSEFARLSDCQLRDWLKVVDPLTTVDLRNRRRISRALEISLVAGRPASQLRTQWESTTANFRGILLVRERAELYGRIAENVSAMFQRGVVAEITRIPKIGPTASMAIGLREIEALLRGELTESECMGAIMLSTRRYAKRQLTWFRNQFIFRPIDLTGLRDTSDIPPPALEFLGAA